MGATSSEILHLLKVKLTLQNDQRWPLLLSWFSKFSGGGPPHPPSRPGNVINFNLTLRNASIRSKVRFSTQGLHKQGEITIDLLCDGYIFVALGFPETEMYHHLS